MAQGDFYLCLVLKIGQGVRGTVPVGQGLISYPDQEMQPIWRELTGVRFVVGGLGDMHLADETCQHVNRESNGVEVPLCLACVRLEDLPNGT